MTKKLLLIITILIILICSIGGVCYADNFDVNFLYNSKNDNVNTITVDSDNQNGNINSLYSNGYRSNISRYSNTLIHIKIYDISITFEALYHFVNNNNINDFDNYMRNYISNYQLVSDGVNVLQPVNLNYDLLSLRITQIAHGSNFNDVYFTIDGSIDFDMPLQNLQLIDSGNGANLNFSSLRLDLFDSRFSINNNTYYLYSIISKSNSYKIEYNLPYVINNVDGFYIFHEFGFFDYTNTSNDINFTNTLTTTINNTNYNVNLTNTQLSRSSYLVNLLNDTKVSNISISCSKSGNQSNNTVYNDSDIIGYHFGIFTPLFFNNNEYFIQTNTNGNLTPLKLNYYDAKWYEIHLQLANGLIFIITELPIISNITNAVYSLFNVVNVAFNTLLQFNGFGYLFTFIMFAIVFGLLIKMFLGE